MRKATVLGEQDLYLFNEGTHARLHDKLGSRLMEHEGKKGAYFALWAPNAEHVSVIGDFNGWDARRNRLHPRESSGIWEGFIEGVGRGALYKYHVAGRRGYRAEKADPFAVRAEAPPKTASVVWDLAYEWGDQGWMRRRKSRNALDAPVSIYEVHLGSWRKGLSYREAAAQLADYARRMGFTHVEFLPVMEHPFGGSWGYQITGYFAPTARFGTPQDFMFLVDALHQADVGVILDWVPSHFPNDGHGLAFFDGTCLYEHADPRQGFHPDWKSAIFNYGRNEVRSFLISNALYWLEKYHADGLRVDAVASMLYLDYSRKEGEWIPNAFGGRENLEAIDFLRRFNREVYRAHPDAQTIAEESTAWQMVSRPVDVGGLGFGLKWDMGWMHDTLGYLRRDPVHRKHHQNEISFRMLYAFHENFCLPLSHDEVVHGKGSLLERMPGDDWQKFANLRLLYAYQFAQPGKKLLFMGGELAQRREWAHDESLDWDLLRWPPHKGVQSLVESLNRIYREQPALHERDCEPAGFEWIDCGDADNSVIAFLRKGKKESDFVAVVCNFTPVPRQGYRVGLPRAGRWREILNTDAAEYGGSGMGNLGAVEAHPIGTHGRPCSAEVVLPPLAALYFTNA